LPVEIGWFSRFIILFAIFLFIVKKRKYIVFGTRKQNVISAIISFVGICAFAGDFVPAPPVINIESGEVLKGTRIKFDIVCRGAKIYYTTDGTEPDETGLLYDEYICITEDTTIKYFLKTMSGRTEIQTATYTIRQPEITLLDEVERIYYFPVNQKKKFFPDEMATRYEIVNCLGVLFYIEPTDIEYGFRDVNEKSRIVDLMVGAGILSGYPDGTFRPDNLISRAEAVTILNKISGKVTHRFDKMTDFEDVTAEHWAYEDIYKAAFYSIY